MRAVREHGVFAAVAYAPPPTTIDTRLPSVSEAKRTLRSLILGLRQFNERAFGDIDQIQTGAGCGGTQRQLTNHAASEAADLDPLYPVAVEGETDLGELSQGRLDTEKAARDRLKSRIRGIVGRETQSQIPDLDIQIVRESQAVTAGPIQQRALMQAENRSSTGGIGDGILSLACRLHASAERARQCHCDENTGCDPSPRPDVFR